MSKGLTNRLNQILPKVTSDAFLSGKGIGNEIAFHIFDYPPEDELEVRRHIDHLLEFIPKRKPGLKVLWTDNERIWERSPQSNDRDERSRHKHKSSMTCSSV